MIEVMVALSILALIAVSLTGGLRLGVRAWETTYDNATDFAAQTSFRTVLYDLLSNARPIWRSTEPNEKEFTFDGTRRVLRFVTVMPDHLGGGLYAVSLVVDSTGSEHALDFERRPFALSRETEGKVRVDRIRVIEGANSISFSYFGSVLEGHEPAWHNDWRGTDQMPDLVRIAVRADPSHETRSWPPLIVRPRVSRHEL
ncbi:MAG: hypothetical protein GY788_17395 [bacterium]|nr:hypothetical protein [bacterium]